MSLCKSLRICALVLLAAAATLACSVPALACATAIPPNSGKPVEIADESAIIIWDADSKTEHFIRRASFRTQADDFGFLVPTPTQPTLASASDYAFTFLAKFTEPKVISKPRPTGGGCVGGCGSAATMPPAEKDEVRVLEEKRVAGYQAAVLEADNTKALGKWLKDHEYEFSPALAEWIKPYVAAGWKVTAFKVAKDAPNEPTVATSAVRMTFRTERPFFPYREPAEKEGVKPRDARLLRVFFLSDSRAQGTLGETGQQWPGKAVWANRLEAGDPARLLPLLNLPAQDAPVSWWLTEFEDHSSPRPGTADVYFSPSEDQSPVERAPHVRYVSRPAPDCIMAYALAAYMLVPCLVRHLRRKREATA